MLDAQLRGAQDAGATHHRRFSWWAYGRGISMRTAAEFSSWSQGRAEIPRPNTKPTKLAYRKRTAWHSETSVKLNSWPIASQQSGTLVHLCGTPVDGKLFQTSTLPGAGPVNINIVVVSSCRAGIFMSCSGLRNDALTPEQSVKVRKKHLKSCLHYWFNRLISKHCFFMILLFTDR